MLTTYTTASEVRAALGVSSTELPDSVILLPIYDLQVTLHLEDANLGIPAKYAALKAQVSPALTTAEQRFLDITHLYATYSAAKEMLISLPLFAVQMLTDGKASFDRQADIYGDVKDAVDNMFYALKIRATNAYGAIVAGVVPATAPLAAIVVISSLGRDPVTNA